MPESARLLTVTAVYQLSDVGRKASLLAGGNGRAMGGPSDRAEGLAGHNGAVACTPPHMEEAATGVG
jgi:hypothetical protein